MIKFQKYAIIADGKRIPVRYTIGKYTKESGLSEDTITVYAKEYGKHLPAELSPQNDSDGREDYFEKDRARITPDNPYYSEVLKFVKR